MRLAPLLVLLLAEALHAQAVRDPNPPEAYYPLHVGDVWEYGPEFVTSPSPYDYPFERRTILGEEVVDEVHYFSGRAQRLRYDASTWSQQESRFLVRFDTTTASVLYLHEGVEQDAVGCRFDLPFPFGECEGSGPFLFYFGSPEETVHVGPDAVTTSTRRLDGVVPGPTFAAGIGDVGRGCEGSCAGQELEFASIDGTVYGARIAILPSAPDLTPPADYYPLEVGNEWIYYESIPIFGQEVYRRRRIVREEIIYGQTYAVEEGCVYNLRATMPTWVCQPDHLVRYDPGTTTVFVLDSDGATPLYCQLGADFGVQPDCGYGVYAKGYTDDGAGSVLIGGVEYRVPQLKGIISLADPGPPPFAAGIGPLEQRIVGPLTESRFDYARVRGVEYGVRPVDSEAAPGASAFALATAPNPTAGMLSLALTLPEAQTVRLEAFDALGRRVWRLEAPLGAGEQRVSVDASAWAPGLYVVRATAGRASATARVVRR